MKYAVQYYENGSVVTDTDSISREEALRLFNTALGMFKAHVYAGGKKSELCLWRDVGDGDFPVYGEEEVSLEADDFELRNGSIVKVQYEHNLPELKEIYD